jgi:hypothetical protein
MGKLKSFMSIERYFYIEQLKKGGLHFPMPFLADRRFPALPSAQLGFELVPRPCGIV